MAEEYHLSLRASLPLLPSSNQGNLTKGRSRALWAVLDEPGSRLCPGVLTGRAAAILLPAPA